MGCAVQIHLSHDIAKKIIKILEQFLSPPRLISKFADKLLRDKAGLKTYAAGKGYKPARRHRYSNAVLQSRRRSVSRQRRSVLRVRRGGVPYRRAPASHTHGGLLEATNLAPASPTDVIQLLFHSKSIRNGKLMLSPFL